MVFPSTKNFCAAGFLNVIVGSIDCRFTGWESDKDGPRKLRILSSPSLWIDIASSIPVRRLPPAWAKTEEVKHSSHNVALAQMQVIFILSWYHTLQMSYSQGKDTESWYHLITPQQILRTFYWDLLYSERSDSTEIGTSKFLHTCAVWLNSLKSECHETSEASNNMG